VTPPPWPPTFGADLAAARDAGYLDTDGPPDDLVIGRPGELIDAGPGYRWLAYQADGEMVAACYADGRLLRRDLRGWWCAGPRGQRRSVPDATVASLLRSVPDGWPVLVEQAPLLGVEVLRGKEAS